MTSIPVPGVRIYYFTSNILPSWSETTWTGEGFACVCIQKQSQGLVQSPRDKTRDFEAQVQGLILGMILNVRSQTLGNARPWRSLHAIGFPPLSAWTGPGSRVLQRSILFFCRSYMETQQRKFKGKRLTSHVSHFLLRSAPYWPLLDGTPAWFQTSADSALPLPGLAAIVKSRASGGCQPALQLYLIRSEGMRDWSIGPIALYSGRGTKQNQRKLPLR